MISRERSATLRNLSTTVGSRVLSSNLSLLRLNSSRNRSLFVTIEIQVRVRLKWRAQAVRVDPGLSNIQSMMDLCHQDTLFICFSAKVLLLFRAQWGAGDG